MFQIAGDTRRGNPRAVFGFDGFLQALGKIILVQLSSLKIILELIVAELLPNYDVLKKIFCANRRGGSKRPVESAPIRRDSPSEPHKN
jgi:hypothetical protein